MGSAAGTIKALSLWQPWASLWASGRKLYETRHWATLYRGPLLIHAAKRMAKDLDPDLAAIVIAQFGPAWVQSLPRGALIGRGELVSCEPVENLRNLSCEELAQGNFTFARYAWELALGRQTFDTPIPWRGQQGLFDVPCHVVEIR